MAAKYYLVKTLNLTHIFPEWYGCVVNDTNVELWPHLFGEDPFAILPPLESILGPNRPILLPSPVDSSVTHEQLASITITMRNELCCDRPYMDPDFTTSQGQPFLSKIYSDTALPPTLVQEFS